eukprot:5620095-Amphidinium_carterae.1
MARSISYSNPIDTPQCGMSKIKPRCLEDGDVPRSYDDLKATPEYLTGNPDDVESIRFLGMEIEKDSKNNNWIVHQQPY